ncbi:MAG: RNA polymerase sigma factor [Saprospiraceae bacterium]|nr:RNA polymerase sigma factor [Saprospiraceae bacterium]
MKEGKAVQNFVQGYSSYLYSICYRVLKQKQIAEEACQDACMKIMAKIGDFKTGSSFKSWMFTIAYRTAIDYQRKQMLDADESVLSSFASGSRAEENYEKEEMQKNLNKLLSHLDEDDALLVSLFYLNEMSVKEIIEATGYSESNIKIKLFRARKEMAKHVEKYFDSY